MLIAPAKWVTVGEKENNILLHMKMKMTMAMEKKKIQVNIYNDDIVQYL